jgi:hypothetical protein
LSEARDGGGGMATTGSGLLGAEKWATKYLKDGPYTIKN